MASHHPWSLGQLLIFWRALQLSRETNNTEVIKSFISGGGRPRSNPGS
ncbi:mCG147566 [Mus musculus]|nr:mCG147566 [Mus musculus]